MLLAVFCVFFLGGGDCDVIVLGSVGGGCMSLSCQSRSEQSERCSKLPIASMNIGKNVNKTKSWKLLYAPSAPGSRDRSFHFGKKGRNFKDHVPWRSWRPRLTNEINGNVSTTCHRGAPRHDQKARCNIQGCFVCNGDGRRG